MSFAYDENNGLHPQPPKKNGDLGAWILIAVMFALCWPVGLILLLGKLGEGGKRPRRQAEAQSRTAQAAVQRVTRTPEYTAKGAKTMKLIGAVLGLVGAFLLLRELDFTLGYVIEYGEWLYLLRQIFYPVGMLAGGLSLLLGSGVLFRSQEAALPCSGRKNEQRGKRRRLRFPFLHISLKGSLRLLTAGGKGGTMVTKCGTTRFTPVTTRTVLR